MDSISCHHLNDITLQLLPPKLLWYNRCLKSNHSSFLRRWFNARIVDIVAIKEADDDSLGALDRVGGAADKGEELDEEIAASFQYSKDLDKFVVGADLSCSSFLNSWHPLIPTVSEVIAVKLQLILFLFRLNIKATKDQCLQTPCGLLSRTALSQFNNAFKINSKNLLSLYSEGFFYNLQLWPIRGMGRWCWSSFKDLQSCG